MSSTPKQTTRCKRRSLLHRIAKSRISSDRRGVAAIEFVLFAPMLLMMIFGMTGFGVYFMFLHELQELSSSAARASLAGMSPSERASLAQQFIATSVSESALLNPADLTVVTGTSGSPATDYSVTVSYSLKDTPIPMLAQLASVTLPDITRTATIELGGY